MPVATADVVAGVRDTAPLLLGIFPFGVIAGAASINAGISPPAVVGLSIAFAGAAQLALVELLREEASIVVMLVAATIINARFSLYSASIAPYLRSGRSAVNLPVAYVLNDHSYALSVVKFEGDAATDRLGYYSGSAIAVWVTWQLGEIVGIVLGQRVPPGFGLDFIVTIVFIALLVPTLDDAATVAAAIAGGGIALLGMGWPFQLGLLAGAVGGILVGLLVEAGVDS